MGHKRKKKKDQNASLRAQKKKNGRLGELPSGKDREKDRAISVYLRANAKVPRGPARKERSQVDADRQVMGTGRFEKGSRRYEVEGEGEKSRQCNPLRGQGQMFEDMIIVRR